MISYLMSFKEFESNSVPLSPILLSLFIWFESKGYRIEKKIKIIWKNIDDKKYIWWLE